MIDDDVVHDAARLVREAAVLRLAHADGRGVVGGDFLHQFERFRTLDPNLAHVRHVENTHAVAYGQVLLNNSFILDRHIVAGKLVHLGAQGDVHVGKRCCFHLLFYLFGDDVT